MTLASDHAIDRRRLKRRLSAWRAAAVLALAALAAAAVGRTTGVVPSAHIARISIKGMIVHDLERDKAIEKLAKSRSVKAVLVHVDSPGGTVVGGERLYLALRKLAEKKPVVTVMDTTATSAGYMVSLAGDHLLAGSGSVTGSIGVLMQTTDVTQLLEKIGVGAEAIKSGALKGVPSPFEKLSGEGRKATKEVVDDIYAMFVEMVAERRKLDPAKARALADGRVFTGRQALGAGLIDAVGGEDEALKWLKAERGVDDKLPVEDVDLDSAERRLPLLNRLLGAWVAGGKMLLSERLTLDGLVSVWHPE
ncbi:MAG: signal peptide peptidase SppA [Rhodospirillales bacterium]